MPQVTVWKCCATGALFESKECYLKHLKDIAKRNLAAKQHSKHIQSAIDIVQSAKNVEQLEIAASKAMVIYYKSRHVSVGDITVTFERLYFNWKCSNSHRCPKNGVTNWGGDQPNTPKGYPGLRGRIDIRYEESTYDNISKARMKRGHQVLDFSNLLEMLCINTGTGGGGAHHLGYDVTLFSDDFPNISEMADPIIEDILT